MWDLKDLEAGDKFWNFTDVKPGDYGINIMSLHAYNNDAYACISIGNITDEENTNIEPEQTAGDTDTPEGELSPFIKIFAWEDSNLNNQYDLLENILVPVNSPLTAAFNPPLSLQASNTKYVGVAWCAGIQSVDGLGVISCDGTSMGNTAQTDSTTATLNFYAEQQRNNPNFSCSARLAPTPTPTPIN